MSKWQTCITVRSKSVSRCLPVYHSNKSSWHPNHTSVSIQKAYCTDSTFGMEIGSIGPTVSENSATAVASFTAATCDRGIKGNLAVVAKQLISQRLFQSQGPGNARFVKLRQRSKSLINEFQCLHHISCCI